MMVARDKEHEKLLKALGSITPSSVVIITDETIYIEGCEVARRHLFSKEMWNQALEFLETEIKTTFHVKWTDSNETRLSKPECIAPQFGERLLLLILTREERANVPGDLEEEYREITAKHGARYAKLWYYKQVTASAWPMIRKAVRWGLLASIGALIRRMI